jgi:hypothetical protein
VLKKKKKSSDKILVAMNQVSADLVQMCAERNCLSLNNFPSEWFIWKHYSFNIDIALFFTFFALSFIINTSGWVK